MVSLLHLFPTKALHATVLVHGQIRYAAIPLTPQDAAMGTSLPGILDDQKGKKFNSTNDVTVCSLIQNVVKLLKALG